MRVLFDDGIDPDVFSPALEATQGMTDRRISERIRAATFVVNVQIVTVTAENSNQDGRIELELLPLARPIHGELAPFASAGEPIKVHLGPGSSGYSLVRSAQGELVGRRMNLCWARFAGSADAEVHWHALSDTPKTKDAIAKAAAIVNFE